MRASANGSETRDSLAVDAALLAVVLMWASSFTLFKIAWREIDPVAFTAIRFAAMVVFAVVVLTLGRARVRIARADVPLLLASGLTGYFLYQMAFVLGLARTSAVAGAILVAMHPIFAVLFAWLLTKDRPSRGQLLGIVVAFLGVAVFLRVWDALSTVRLGDLFSLGAAVAFGAYGVITRPLAGRYPSRELMAYGLLSGGLLIALVGLPAAVAQDWSGISFGSWVIVAYAIVGPVYLAYALWNWAIRERGIARTVVYGFLVPVLGGALAVFALGEDVTAIQVAGALLVVVGLVVTRFTQDRGTPPATEDERVLEEVAAPAAEGR